MHLQPSNVSTARVVLEPADVISRLADIHPSLDEQLLLEANARGYEARLEATPAHAPTAAGTLHWHAFVAALRTELRHRDWTIKNHKNCPFIVSPDKAIMLLVMTGDVDTGKQFGNPTNQADKGTVLGEAVEHNQQYELFENTAVTALERGNSGTQLWVLLYHVERGGVNDREIRTELSLPSKFGKKKILDWSERIILNSIPLDPLVNVDEPAPLAPTEPIDVPVERKNV